MTRIDLYTLLVSFGGFLRPLSMMILKPQDLATLSRRYYSMEKTIQGYSDPALVDSGLMPEEAGLLDQVQAGPDRRALVLGIGGGRTVVGFGDKGYEIYGMDHSSEMVKTARRNCGRKNIRLHGIVQEVSQLGFRRGSFDLVFFTPALYSVIPTQNRRREMLERVSDVLKPGGQVICQFFWKKDLVKSPVKETVKKMAARLISGYTEYETGDFIRGKWEFIHAFHDREILFSEFQKAGFVPVKFAVFQNGFFGGALLKQSR